MSRFGETPSFPPKLRKDGNLEILPVVAYSTALIPGAIMLALRCGDSEESIRAGGNQTIQVALTLIQIQDLMDALATAETVLSNAQSSASERH